MILHDSGVLMAEMADAGEDHGEAEAVGGVDYVLILDRSARLDDGGGAGLGDGLKAVGKGKKSTKTTLTAFFTITKPPYYLTRLKGKTSSLVPTNTEFGK